MNRMFGLRIAAVVLMTLGLCSWQAHGQAAQPEVVPEFIQQAQMFHIPLHAIYRDTTLPVKDLTGSNISLDVDGQPHPFQLSRPWANTINPKTGQAEDRPNLLIILPLDGPLNRKDALNEAINDLSKEPDLGWNISILDDSGDQTPYTRDLKSVIADLKRIEDESPDNADLAGWRTTAALAIASMRDLPGRRVVMSLGDIYHEMVIEQGELVYENFAVDDIATAARNAGAVIYAAESFTEIGNLRGLTPYYSVTGNGPWLLLTRNGHVAGWISNSVSDTVQEIRNDGMGAYNLDLHLSLKQMDGQLHVVSVTARQAGVILDAPPFYVAPSLAELRQLANLSPALRNALHHVPAAGSSPLQMATQLAYFPHADRKSGTQIATTGFFWSGTTPPPPQLDTALQLDQPSSGFIAYTTTGVLQWSSTQPVWNLALNVGPGAYTLRVAAGDAAGKITAGTETPFTVEPTTDEPVLISSLVLGKSCLFAPPPAEATTEPTMADFLRAGNCELQPDPSHYFSPQDIVWTLLRITPTGKLATRPSKDWKSSFIMIDAKGSKLAEERAQWLPGEDGSLVATAAFPLENPKLKLQNGQYAIVFQLKGPGIEDGYEQNSPFIVYGVSEAAPESKH